MKKIILFMAFVVCTVTASAQDYRYMILQMNNGSAITVESAGLDMTVNGDNLIVKADGDTKTLLISDMKSMQFSETPAGLTEIADIEGEIRAYTSDGLFKGIYKSIPDAFRELDTPGIYILKGKNTHVKIMIER